MKESYLNQNNDSIIEYCEMVLNNSKYPNSFPKNYELEYNPDNKMTLRALWSHNFAREPSATGNRHNT